MIPRPYQTEAVEAAFGELATLPSTLIVMATGLGKTVTFGVIARQWLAERPRDRVLILAHREELLTQARNTLHTIVGFRPQLERGPSRADHPLDLPGLFAAVSDDRAESARVVVASVQSLWRENRIDRFDPDQFGLVVVDEAHHCVPQARTYWRIREHFEKAKWLGVTATPQRADQFALGQSFESVAYEFGIQQAVEGGWLVPVEQQFVQVDSLDLSAVRAAGEDLNQSELSRAMTKDEQTSWQVAAATVQHFGEEPTLIFTCARPPGEPQSQGEQVAEALNSIKPRSAVHLTGETDPEIRRRTLEQYAAGDLQYLIGCDLFTEGFDMPRISRVVMARPTASIVYYTQAIGRGTRPLPGVLTPDHDTPEKRLAAIANSDKPRLIVMDFVGNSGKHKLMSCVDIFAGKHGGQSREIVQNRAKKAAGPVNVNTLFAEWDEEKRQAAVEAEHARVNARVVYRTEDVSPFEYTDPATARAKRNKGSDAATATQLEWIQKHGGPNMAPDATVGEAGAVIAEMKRRYKAGLCSHKQEKVLKSRKLIDGPIPKVCAKALCDWLAGQGWPFGVQRPQRSDLGFHREADGIRLTIHGTPVGGYYRTYDDVRAAYAALVARPREVDYRPGMAPPEPANA